MLPDLNLLMFLDFPNKMELNEFLTKLESTLKNVKLKGKASQIKMSPLVGNEPYRPFEPSDTASKSAVLLLLVGDSFDNLKILFTLRSSKLPLHSNQISFPGGHCERDEDIRFTALRETFEEIGLNSKDIKILGELSKLYVPPSDTIISPVVGYLSSLKELKVNKVEVEEVFLVDLRYFFDETKREEEIWEHKSMQIKVSLWRVHPKVPLWGATAMILSEFIDIAKEILTIDT